MSSVLRGVVVIGVISCLGKQLMSQDAILAGGADPTIVSVAEVDGQSSYYVFSTAPGVRISHSHNLKDWQLVGRVFQEDVPAWAQNEIPESRGIWAPDISYHDGLYYLYYSVSSFGSQRSVIGLAVNRTLDQTNGEYKWIDRGKVVESFPGKCDYNAIDPALFVDTDGQWYLFFGSFWSGIKVVALESGVGKPRPNAQLMPVAARPDHRTHALEAPFVIHRQDYYYLFVSWDRCCDGADSDYKVMVGRSRKVTGPYADAEGRPLLKGGGTLVLSGDDRWRGPGHNSVLTTDNGQWLVHHTYDIHNLRAHRILQIRPLVWTTALWPQVGKPIFEPKK